VIDLPEIQNINYNQYVKLVGTAHFTKRSLEDAYNAVKYYEPNEIALELDLERFRHLKASTQDISRYQNVCEFIGAADAIGNVDANIWLIDMAQQQIQKRIDESMTPMERSNLRFIIYPHIHENPVLLWENGYKQRVINKTKMQIEKSRRYYPSLWRVLIDERNTLMAARTAWVITSSLEKDENPKILVFVGAAHTDGIEYLLKDPIRIKENLEKYNILFSEPTLIRRISIHDFA
jgi:pheromone shutdown protein TraB